MCLSRLASQETERRICIAAHRRLAWVVSATSPYPTVVEVTQQCQTA